MDSNELIIGIILLFIFSIVFYLMGKFVEKQKLKSQIPEIREDAIKKSRAVLSGQFSEQIAPYLPDFSYKPTEARFIGKPVDFIVFRGMDEKKIEEVIFIEVKSGKSNLNNSEKSLKSAIEGKKVRWEDCRIPENLTKRA